MKDFSEQAKVFTPDGVLEGLDSIRKFYIDVTTNIIPPGSEFNLTRQEVRGQTAYIVWSAESKNYRFSTRNRYICYQRWKNYYPDVCSKN